MAAFVLDGKFLTEVQNRQRKGLTAAGLEYLKLMAQTWSRPGHGIRYEKVNGGTSLRALPIGPSKKSVKIHVASAPGEPPAILTGRLMKSTAQRIGAEAGGDLRAEFGASKVPYAHRLEKGGTDKRGVTIAPRPAWEPTMKASFPVLMEYFAGAFRRG